jgi:protein TonB
MSDTRQLLESRRSRIGRWGGAAVIVCILHVGGAALALMNWQEEDEEAAGALTLEMAPLPAAGPVDSPEFLAHGPLTQDAPQTPQATDKVEEEVVRDIPPVDPSPAPEPEIALPKPQPEKKEEPEKEEPKEAAAEKQSPAEASEQQVATAPPRAEAQPAPTSAGSEGLSARLVREQRRWVNALAARIKRFTRYPDAADRRGISGVTVVRFWLDREGQVVASEVLKSSGSPILDQEALATIKRASPYPVPPDGLLDKYLENHSAIWFRMKPKQ